MIPLFTIGWYIPLSIYLYNQWMLSSEIENISKKYHKSKNEIYDIIVEIEKRKTWKNILISLIPVVNTIYEVKRSFKRNKTIQLAEEKVKAEYRSQYPFFITYFNAENQPITIFFKVNQNKVTIVSEGTAEEFLALPAEEQFDLLMFLLYQYKNQGASNYLNYSANIDEAYTKDILETIEEKFESSYHVAIVEPQKQVASYQKILKRIKPDVKEK